MIRPPGECGSERGRQRANRPTFAGESRRKCPRNHSGSLGWWVFGESRVLLRRAIVAVSSVLGRDGCGRHGFGCWVARVSAGALQPESDSECPLSLQHAVAGVSLRKGEWLRAQRASFLEVSPRSRGKDELRQGQRPARGARLRSTSCAARFGSLAGGLPSATISGASSRLPPVSAPPGKGCRGPAECVTVWFVHAF